MTPNDLIPTPRWLLGQLLQALTAPTTSITLNFAGHQQLSQLIATTTMLLQQPVAESSASAEPAQEEAA
jgi:hypothetical protein